MKFAKYLQINSVPGSSLYSETILCYTTEELNTILILIIGYGV